jgi:hypothetical protein
MVNLAEDEFRTYDSSIDQTRGPDAIRLPAAVRRGAQPRAGSFRWNSAAMTFFYNTAKAAFSYHG